MRLLETDMSICARATAARIHGDTPEIRVSWQRLLLFYALKHTKKLFLFCPLHPFNGSSCRCLAGIAGVGVWLRCGVGVLSHSRRILPTPCERPCIVVPVRQRVTRSLVTWEDPP